MTRSQPNGPSAAQMTAAARSAVKTNALRAYVGGGGLIALGGIIIVGEFVMWSAPGHSGIPVGLAFVGAGVAYLVGMRVLLRRNAQWAEDMAAQIRRRAQRFAEALAAYPLSVHPQPRYVALLAAVLGAAVGGVCLVACAAALLNHRLVSVLLAQVFVAVTTLGIAGILYTWVRGPRHESTLYNLTLHRRRRAVLQYSSVTRVELKRATIVVRHGHVAGFRITFTLVDGSGFELPIRGYLSGQPASSSARGELTTTDLVCWLWVNKCPELGVAVPPPE